MGLSTQHSEHTAVWSQEDDADRCGEPCPAPSTNQILRESSSFGGKRIEEARDTTGIPF